MADRVRDELKFDYAIANRLICRNGRLTGLVKVNLEHGSKHTILARLCRRFRIKPHEVIAIGDSEGDVPMAAKSGYSIAFNCTSETLAKTVDYNCKTADFNEVYRKIISVCYE
jgi:phosphoserine phosphatase